MERALLLERLRGLFPAAVTPFRPDESLDHEALAALVEWWNGFPLAGLLMLGSTGELVHLSDFERALVLEVTRRHLPEDRILIAGCGRSGTGQTIEACRRAAEAGASAALVVTPNYYQSAMSGATLERHYRLVADASPIPVLLYSVPQVTGITLPATSVGVLAAHENIIGMKNSSGDASLAAAYRAAAPPPFTILAGSATLAPGAILTGLADGAILAIANILPEASATMVRAARAGRVEEATAAATLLNEAGRRIGRHGIGGYKAALEARGLPAGPPRPPLAPPDSAAREEIRTVMADLSPTR